MQGGEELVVAAAAVVAVVAEVAGAVVLRYHTSLLRGTVAVADYLLPQFEDAGIDVDVAIGVKHCLSVHVSFFYKNFFVHLGGDFAREGSEKRSY